MQNVERIAAAGQQVPHTIVALESEHELFSFTCLVHALGFTGKSNYSEIALLPGQNVFAGAGFAEWLMQRELLKELDLTEATPGSLAMYFALDGSFRHVGVVRQGQRVESKWGQLGLFEHGLWEVPNSYGESVRFFKALSFEEAMSAFYAYAEEQGVAFEDDGTDRASESECK